MQHWNALLCKNRARSGKVSGALSGVVRLESRLPAAFRTTQHSGQMRGAQGEALSTADSEDVTHTFEWPMKPLTLPPPPHHLSLYLPLFFFLSTSLKRESMQSKGSYKAMALYLSLTVGDSGRLRSLSTETLQHMRSFLKEWPQNPH